MKRAFSLIEIMVTVTLLAGIILGLVTAFNTTQRAMTYGMGQTDTLAAGRTAGEMLSRELEQMTPAPTGFFTFWGGDLETNIWALPGTNVTTNVLGFGSFHLGYQPGDSNRQGTMITYVVFKDANGAGALNRVEFKNGGLTNTNAIIDGVVAFRMQTLNRNGAPDTNLFTNGIAPRGVEWELAVLEKRTWEQYQALSNNAAAAKQFLTNQAGHLHVFRQRIQVKSAE